MADQKTTEKKPKLKTGNIIDRAVSGVVDYLLGGETDGLESLGEDLKEAAKEDRVEKKRAAEGIIDTEADEVSEG